MGDSQDGASHAVWRKQICGTGGAAPAGIMHMGFLFNLEGKKVEGEEAKKPCACVIYNSS